VNEGDVRGLGNSPVPSDQELLERARAGDQDAFRMLVERYEGAVAATVIGMLGPGGDADDVGQEVFLRFYRSIDRFRGDSALKTYLTRIAINLSLNAIKKRRTWLDRFLSRDRADDEATLAEPAVEGERIAETRDAAAIVHGGLQKLTPEHRSVVVLRMIEGYSTRETAEILGLPQGTVMSRLKRAMVALETELRPVMEHGND
jgi:RNA polymerase sigma-70 factor (ECF subfamily)